MGRQSAVSHPVRLHRCAGASVFFAGPKSGYVTARIPGLSGGLAFSGPVTDKDASHDLNRRPGFSPTRVDFSNFRPQHFQWQRDGKVATITLNWPERKNPLTLESYAELRDTFRDPAYRGDIANIVITGAGGNFCSGGDVHEIIGPLVEMQRTTTWPACSPSPA